MTSGGDFHEDQLIKLLLKNANTIDEFKKTGGLISTNIIWSRVIVQYTTDDSFMLGDATKCGRRLRSLKTLVFEKWGQA